MGAVEHEREFGIGELFFSTTDPKGIIQSGNRVFQRVAAFEEAEMLGRPHSLIRHPDVPRCVFKLLWDTIDPGQTIAAYVKNRARTGEPYWVVATVAPCEGGFLSVRLRPSTAYFETAKSVYPILRELELEIGGDREIDRKKAMAASTAKLTEILNGAGFADYSAFMHAFLSAEMASRARQIGPLPDAPPGTVGMPLRVGRDAALAITNCLGSLFGASLDGYSELSAQLASKAAFVSELAESLRLFSLNALLASTRLGRDGVALHAVSGIMGRSSVSMRTLIRDLSVDLQAAQASLDEVGFRIAVASLQAQMVIVFVDELIDEARSSSVDVSSRNLRLNDLSRLAGCIGDSLAHLRTALNSLNTQLRGVANTEVLLAEELKVMAALEINGRIEAARVANAAETVQLFREIQSQVAAARAQLDDLATITATGCAAASRTAAKNLDREVERIHRSSTPLAA